LSVQSSVGVTTAYGAHPAGVTLALSTMASLPAQNVSIAATASTAVEGGAAAGIRLSRTGSTAIPCAVRLAFAGTAANRVDLAYQPGFAIIPAGAASVDVALAAVADGIAEGAEPFSVAIEASPGDYTIAGGGSASLQVVDTANQAPVIGSPAAAPASLVLP
jgi:hypothetical protein